MPYEPQEIDRIIARHLGSKATSEEQHQLQAWLAESESNRAFFEALISTTKPNVEKAWGKFQQHMQQEEAPLQQIKIWSLSSIMLRYAAAIVLLIGLSVFAWIRFDASPTILVVAENNQQQAQEHTLQDSTTVFLNKNSTLAYLGSFGKGKREVQLEGEAFFEISESGNGQFLVHAEETLIKDIGTSFNVQAYPSSDSIIVFVQSGEVHFYAESMDGVMLQGGETGIFDKRTKIFTRHKTGETNIAIAPTKLFVFKDKPLHEAVKLINQIYNVHISIGDSTTASQPISVTFDNESIEEIVEVIGETMHLHVAQKDSTYLLKK